MKHLKNNYDVNNILSVHLACIVPNSATVISSFFLQISTYKKSYS